MQQGEDFFTFASKWYYKGEGDAQTLDVRIEKPTRVKLNIGKTPTLWLPLVLSN